MSERGFGVKANSVRASWEDTEFPVLCGTCLGENPYVRMLRETHGDACKLCQRPFAVFRWKASAKGRTSRTAICQTCAKLKNACQCCVLDLTYGLPVQIRDAFLASQNLTTAPTTAVNREYYAQMQERMAAQGHKVFDPTAQNEALLSLARSQADDQGKLGRLCTFFAKGYCNKGASCPYKHELIRNDGEKLTKEAIQDAAATRAAADVQLVAQNAASTLWVFPAETLTAEDFRGALYVYGEIKDIKLVPARNCALVEFATPGQAAAALHANPKLNVKGRSLRVAWAQSQMQTEAAALPPPPPPPPRAAGAGLPPPPPPPPRGDTGTPVAPVAAPALVAVAAPAPAPASAPAPAAPAPAATPARAPAAPSMAAFLALPGPAGLKAGMDIPDLPSFLMPGAAATAEPAAAAAANVGPVKKQAASGRATDPLPERGGRRGKK